MYHFPHRVVKERDEVYDNYLKQVMKLAALYIYTLAYYSCYRYHVEIIYVLALLHLAAIVSLQYLTKGAPQSPNEAASHSF